MCGIPATKSKPLVVNGTNAKITDFPWHATLYKGEHPNSEKMFLCGATIIQDDLLVTAAHCVYNEIKRKVDDATKFYVATGNVFRDYDYALHNPVIVKKAQVCYDGTT